MMSCCCEALFRKYAMTSTLCHELLPTRQAGSRKRLRETCVGVGVWMGDKPCFKGVCFLVTDEPAINSANRV